MTESLAPIYAARIKIERCVQLVRKNQFRGSCVTIKMDENAAIRRKKEGDGKTAHPEHKTWRLRAKMSTMFALDCERSTVDCVYVAGMQPSHWSKSLIRVSSASGCNTRSAKIWFIHHVGIIDRARRGSKSRARFDSDEWLIGRKDISVFSKCVKTLIYTFELSWNV